jgi:hypothetical protein
MRQIIALTDGNSKSLRQAEVGLQAGEPDVGPRSNCRFVKPGHGQIDRRPTGQPD